MRRKILRRIAVTAFRFAWIALAILVLATALAASGVKRIRLDTGLSDFLPPESPDARLISEAIRDYRNLEPIVVDVRAERGTTPEEMGATVREFAELIDDPQYFSEVVYRADDLDEKSPGMTDVRLMALLTDSDWAQTRDLIQTSSSTERLTWERMRRITPFVPRRIMETETDPLGVLTSVRDRMAVTRAPIPVTPEEGYLYSIEQQSFRILVYPARPSDDGFFALRVSKFLSRANSVIHERHPEWKGSRSIEFAGSHIETAEKLSALARKTGVILGCSLLLALALLVHAYRKAEAVLFTLIPPAMGLVWTLGLAHYASQWLSPEAASDWGEATTQITGVTVAFLLITFGLGMNQSLQLFSRFTQELYKTKNYYRALQVAYVETGRGILASSAIASMIFFSLYFASFEGLKEMGLLAGVSVLCNLAATLLAIPVFASVKSRLARGIVSPVEIMRFNIMRMCQPALRTPRATLGALLLVTVFLGFDYGAAGLNVVSLKLHPRFTSIAAYLFRSDLDRTEKSEAASRPGRPVVALVEWPTLEGALQQNDSLYDRLVAAQGDTQWDYGILAVDSLRMTLPSLKTQARSLENLKSLDLAKLNDSVAVACWRSGFQPVLFRQFLSQLEKLQATARTSPLRDITRQYDLGASEELQRDVQRLVTQRDGVYRVATPIFPDARGFTPKQLTALLAILADGPPVQLIGDPIVEREISKRLQYDLAWFALCGTLSVAVSMALHFRRKRPAGMAIAAVAAQMLWLIGAMGIFDIPLHMFTLMALALVAALAVDHSIQMIQHFQDRQALDVRLAIHAAGRAAGLSALMVALLYGSLALNEFEGLRDMGRVILMGVVADLVATLILLPALIRIWGHDEPLASALRPPREIESSDTIH